MGWEPVAAVNWRSGPKGQEIQMNAKHGKINDVAVRCIYRATAWTARNIIRLFVTVDGRIWIGYGEMPERFSHVANVGDRDSVGTSRDAILRAANA